MISYFVGLGLYVVMKEVRKHRREHYPSRHRGEVFVWFWLILFLTSTALIMGVGYQLDTVYKLIVNAAMVSLIVFFGGKISRVYR